MTYLHAHILAYLHNCILTCLNIEMLTYWHAYILCNICILTCYILFNCTLTYLNSNTLACWHPNDWQSAVKSWNISILRVWKKKEFTIHRFLYKTLKMWSKKCGDLRFWNFFAKKLLRTFLCIKMQFMVIYTTIYSEISLFLHTHRKYLFVFISYQNFIDFYRQ